MSLDRPAYDVFVVTDEGLRTVHVVTTEYNAHDRPRTPHSGLGDMIDLAVRWAHGKYAVGIRELTASDRHHLQTTKGMR